jgi:hypothetical protein
MTGDECPHCLNNGEWFDCRALRPIEVAPNRRAWHQCSHVEGQVDCPIRVLRAELDALRERAVPEDTTCIEWLEHHGDREYDGDCLQTGAPHPRGTCDYQVYCDRKLIASGLEPSGLKAYLAARRAIAAAEAAAQTEGGETT